MSIASGTSPIHPEPELLGQTVVVIGGSGGIGLETARRARAEGAKLILAARDPKRLEDASRELGPLSSAAFDATNFDHKTECDDSGGARLSVKDSGVGIDSETEEKLFKAFYTTKGDGMGFGLSVSRSIVERHQGRLWAIRN